jgi:hypothetical protein
MGPLQRDTVWSGEVYVTGDVLIPAGTTLHIRPGTIVKFARRPKWACSVFWRSPLGDSVEGTMRELCDLVVAGHLEATGTKDEPVRLGTESDPWGGITCFDRGAVRLVEATLERAPHFSIQSFDAATVVGEGSRCRDAEFGIWGWGTSRIEWTRGEIRATRISVICCEGSRAHLVEVDDRSNEGVAANDWALIRVDGGRFAGPRKHCVVASNQSWVKLRGCRTAEDSLMDVVRLDDAQVDVAA